MRVIGLSVSLPLICNQDLFRLSILNVSLNGGNIDTNCQNRPSIEMPKFHFHRWDWIYLYLKVSSDIH